MENTILHKRMEENASISNKATEKVIEDAYKIGEATLIAYLLDSINTKGFTLNEVTQYLYGIINRDAEKKDYVYELMKNIK